VIRRQAVLGEDDRGVLRVDDGRTDRMHGIDQQETVGGRGVSAALFPLGRVLATPGSLGLLEETGTSRTS
jgi:hypothetical protein